MPFCINCGQELADSAKFCANCGTPVSNQSTDSDCNIELTVSVKLSGPIDAKTDNIVYVPYLNKSVKVAVPNSVQKDQVLRLSGLGKVLPDGQQGDLYLRVKEIHMQENTTSKDEKKDQTKRREEWAGKIIKCPACGEDIPSFTAICPACGHEINESKISDTLRHFIEQINDCERNITINQSTSKIGWDSWSKGKRICWVVLNILFLCIPLVIYLIIPMIFINATPKLTKEEKHMATLIENFSFPNDRKSILEALIFTKEKIDFISKENIDRKSAYWIRLWCSKAKQLKQKADMLFPNDIIVKQNYDEIIEDESVVRKALRIKAIIGIVIFIAVAVFVSLKSGIIDTKNYNMTFEWPETGMLAQLPEPESFYGRIVSEDDKQIQVEVYKLSPKQFDDYANACRAKGFDIDIAKNSDVFYANNAENYNLNISYDESKRIMKISIDSHNVIDNNFEAGSYESINIKNFTFDIPNYWEEEGSKNEYLQYYAEKGDKVVMLSIAYPEESDDTYEVSFDGLYADNSNMLEAVGAMFTDGDVIDHEVFESEYGVKGILYHFTYNQKIDWFTKADGSGYCFCFPSESDRRWFYVVLMHTNNIASDDYKNDYITLISNIKERS